MWQVFKLGNDLKIPKRKRNKVKVKMIKINEYARLFWKFSPDEK